MKAGHTGDLHLTAGPRFGDTTQVLDWIAADGAAAGVDVWLVGGDLVGTHDVPHIATVEERDFLDRWFQQLAQTAPVVILYGNHDSPRDMMGYGRLKAPHPITVVTEPTTLTLADTEIVCVPFPHRRYWLERAGDGAISEQLDAANEALHRWLLAETQRAAATGGPVLVFGHFNVKGAEVGGSEILSGHEVELSAEQLDALPVDGVRLSHIHKHQPFYAGSPIAQSFGEPEQKGYCVVTIERGAEAIVDFRPTPTRRLVTVDARWDGQRFAVSDTAVPAGAEVKVRLAIPEQYIGTCPTAELEAQFGGAHRVIVDPTVVAAQRLRSEAIQYARTDAERLAAWWESLGEQAPDAATRDRLLAKLAAITAGLAAGDDQKIAAAEAA